MLHIAGGIILAAIFLSAPLFWICSAFVVGIILVVGFGLVVMMVETPQWVSMAVIPLGIIAFILWVEALDKRWHRAAQRPIERAAHHAPAASDAPARARRS